MTGRRIGWALVCVLGLAGAGMATEGGGGAYPNGAEDFMTGALPPPGNYLIDYNLWYTASDIKDGNGNSLPIPFNLNVVGTIPRFVHVSQTEILGASWAQHVFVPLIYEDVKTPAGSDSRFGLGDIIVDPFILGWHCGPLHAAAGLDIYVPVGTYDKEDMANIGRNYWTLEPVLGVTLLCPKTGMELSAKFMYDVNFENSETDIRSGDEFHFDYAVGQHLKNWTIGASGFFYTQVTDDEYPAGLPPQALSDKGQAWSIGPAIAYQYKAVQLTCKWQPEFDVESKPQGDRFWLKLVMPL